MTRLNTVEVAPTDPSAEGVRSHQNTLWPPDSRTRESFDPVYERADGFYNNRAFVRMPGQDGLQIVTPDGTGPIQTAYSDALPFSQSACAAKDASSGLWGISGVSGTWTVEPQFSSAGRAYELADEDYYPVQDASSGLWGCVSGRGVWLVAPCFAALA